jgi:hypothetical protein
MYAWAITKDHINEGHDENTCWTHGADDLNHAYIVTHPEKQKFRMYDDDGELYYEGYYVGDFSEDAFGPLDDFGMPNAGCTRIDYWNETKQIWETL